MPSIGLLSRLLLLGVASAVLGYIIATWTQESRQQAAIAEHAEQLYRAPASFVAGNPDGDVSIVAFFDYNCPYCRHGAPELDKLVEADGKLRLVLKELPVLGKDSEEVARIAQASIPQGKYFELYEKLISTPGRATKERALGVAQGLGLDMAALAKGAEEPAVESAIAANKALADAVGVKGVPFYLVGDKPVGEGELLYDRLVAAVADIRANGCKAKC